MTDSVQSDAIWQAAVGWLMREHEQRLDPGARKELVAWLAQDPAHRAAYDKASLLWLLTGLVPPSSAEHPSPIFRQDE